MQSRRAKGSRSEITLTPGQQHDATEAEHLIQFAHGKALIADAAFDADRIIAAAKERGLKPVIAMHPSRKYNKRRKSPKLYELRIEVEHLFHNLKRFRAIATRHEKSATNFLALVHVACITLWIN